MQRTTIMLDEQLKARVALRAREQGVSLGQWIRVALAQRLEEPGGGGRRDPLLGDAAVFNGDSPVDLAERHDDYLYR